MEKQQRLKNACLTLLSLLLIASCSPAAVDKSGPEGAELYSALVAERSQLYKDSLILTVEDDLPGCHQLGGAIKIRFSFQNAADATMVFHKDLRISSDLGQLVGNLVPRIMTADGKAIVPDGWRNFDIRGDYPQPQDFTRIESQASFEEIIEFTFPVEEWVGDTKVFLSAGQYFVSFTYRNRGIGSTDEDDIAIVYDLNAWVGEIESNQIEICIQNPSFQLPIEN